MSETLRAVVYLSTQLHDLAIWRIRCLTHCVNRGYDIAAVVTGAAAAYATAERMIRKGEAEVIVTTTYEDLPPQRLPRIEEAGTPERTEQAAVVPMQRRARVTRRR